MLSGDDANAIPMMALGGEGLISVMGNAYPDVWAEAMDLALFGSVKEAEQHLAAHRSLMDVLFAEGNPTGINGMRGDGPHKPSRSQTALMPASVAHRDALYKAMADMDAVPNRPIPSSDA